MKATHRLSRGWFLLPALAAAAVAIPAASASANTNTICTALGLPSSSNTVGVPGVGHVRLDTCGAALTPPAPPCNPIDLGYPGVIHVRVFACPPGTSLPIALSPAGSSAGVDGLTMLSAGAG